jgi:hypothetical protein
MSDLMKVGPDFGGTGTFKPFTADVTGAQRASNAHAFYFDATTRRMMFNGAITGQVTTVGLATTYTGLCLSNPINSGYNIVLTKVGLAFIVAFAAGAAVGLMTGYHASTDVVHTTPAVPKSSYIGGSATGVAKLDSAATLPATPVVNTVLMAGLTGAITTTPAIPCNFDMDGSIVLSPGGFVAVYTSTASGAAAGAFSFTWEEVPLLV